MCTTRPHPIWNTNLQTDVKIRNFIIEKRQVFDSAYIPFQFFHAFKACASDQGVLGFRSHQKPVIPTSKGMGHEVKE